MQVKHKTEKLNTCSCGHKPDHFWVGYSRTPYYMQCECGKRVDNIGGAFQNMVDAWNKIADNKLKTG